MFRRIAVAFCILGLLFVSLVYTVPAFASQPAPVEVAQQLTFDPICQNAVLLAEANEIVQENCEPGTPAEVWDIELPEGANATLGAGDPSLQGFATDISVNRGSTIQFKIDSKNAEAYTIPIYRLGYYGGDGARLVWTIPSGQISVTAQPPCDETVETVQETVEEAVVTKDFTLLDCGNWAVSASWDVLEDATSGVYIARPTHSNGSGSHIVFIVRDDSSHSDLLFQTSDTTWQSYNPFGGYNAYGTAGAVVAPKLSYNRPFATRAGELENWLFNSEYPMIRWLERNGYDVAYMSAVDTERNANLIPHHKVFMSVGHDEYWSPGRRGAVEAAREAGVHLAFLSGNEVYWKTRWEPSSFGAQQYRTQVTFKEGNAAPSGSDEHRFCTGYSCDPTGIWTGLWRQAPGSTPENSLSGQISWRYVWPGGPITVGSDYANLRFWRNTAVAGLVEDAVVTLTNGILGYEADPEYAAYAQYYPPGRIQLSSTEFSSFAGVDTHHLSLYRYGTGENSALVFGAGTVQWAWGLDSEHDRSYAPVDPNVQQATVNLFADMDNVQPQTPADGVVPADMSSDFTAPQASFTSHTDGAQVQGMTMLGGEASDVGGHIGGVEVSTDNGLTWHPAQGRESWTYAWSPTSIVPTTIQVRAFDDSGNMQATPASITLEVLPRTCPCSIWGSAAPTGAVPEPNPQTAVELGVRFQSDLPGYITALRFYKDAGNPGAYTGHLWNNEGELLASAVFETDNAAGWQEAPLDNPQQIDANVSYVASYHSPSGAYVNTVGGFNGAVINPPLSAPANTPGAPNGVYVESATPAFPRTNWQSANYWVDVVFAESVGPDASAPVVSSPTPANGSANAATTVHPAVTFNEWLDGSTVSEATVKLFTGATEVPVTVSYPSASLRITIAPESSLAYNTLYTVVLTGGTSGIKDLAGNALAGDYQWSFTTRSAPPPVTGPGGPILVVSSANPFATYYTEILRAEGLNSFDVKSIAEIDANPSLLNNYKVVILGEMALEPTQVALFDAWVQGGGNLIAMRPGSELFSLMGISPAAGNALAEGYLLVNTSQAPGAGIVNQTIQYHGAADRYSLSGATSVATLYNDATSVTSPANPAVTLRAVGANGGQAASFAFDLAKSVVYTRQGNPAWEGQERDGETWLRANDMFFGNLGTDPQPDWVNLDKVAIPQADEAQRLLANMITLMLADDFPMPRFWYFPRGEKAVVVMTHDDHGTNNVVPRLNSYNAVSPAGCDVANWECIRSTTYLYPNSVVSDVEINDFEAQGHEFGAHVNVGGNCFVFDGVEDLDAIYDTNFAAYAIAFPSADAQVTERTHCIAFSDWFSQPTVELDHGVRMDTNYYYWPPAWVQNRPGMFTGSGMPMRFADTDGTMIDVYQATTQLPDESDQIQPLAINTLLARALGPEGYYGAFVTNMHTDHPGSDEMAAAIVASAQSNGVPVISAKQLLEWTDARNASSFSTIAYDAGAKTLSFSVAANSAAHGLAGMIPAQFDGNSLADITRDGQSIAYDVQTIKGVAYAQYAAETGDYVATFDVDETAPTIVSTTPAMDATDVPVASVLSATFSEPINGATLSNGFMLEGPNGVVPVDFSVAGNVATMTPQSPLQPSTLYTAQLNSAVTDIAGNALTAATLPVIWSFTTSASAFNCPCTVWEGVTPGGMSYNENKAVEVGVRFRSSVGGYISGVRFYQDSVGSTLSAALWSETGTEIVRKSSSPVPSVGWHEVIFDNPVEIAPNTIYVASYTAPVGVPYWASNPYFTGDVVNEPLTVPGTANGVYKPTGGAFPDETYQGSNYWVDPIFVLTASADNTPPAIQARIPGPAAATVPANTNVSVQFSEQMDPSTVNVTTIRLRDVSAGVDVPATVTYAGTTAILDPSTDLEPVTLYQVTVAGSVADLIGNMLGSDDTWQFTTAIAPPNTFSIWEGEVTPVLPIANDPGANELGVKFRSSESGQINGVRIWRGSLGGAFNVTLWTRLGASLATATSAPVSTIGWQDVLFAESVPIDANTTYVASYSSPAGSSYAATVGYFATQGTENPPLTALMSGVDGGNGVAGVIGTFPTSTYNDANYWVDVIFEPVQDTTRPQVTARTPVPNTENVALNTNVTVQFNEVMLATAISGGLSLRAQGTGTAVDADVTYDSGSSTAILNPVADLAPGTLYNVTLLGTVTDASGNALGEDVTWSFTTLPPSVGDDLVADEFAAGDFGTTPSCYLAESGNGEIILAPTLGAEFSGTTLPAGWVSDPWVDFGNGSGVVSGGVLTIDGARVAPTSGFVSSGAIEFSATFAAQQFQHAGFANDYNDVPWVMFSTGNQTSSLFARAMPGSGDTNVGPIPAGMHRYRIEWDGSVARFYIDGVLAHTATSGATSMHPAFSELNGGTPLVVDWMRMSPYTGPCTFTSRVLDAGAPADWQQLVSTGARPGGTTIAFETRTGNTPEPDEFWNDWEDLLIGDSVDSPPARYIQYRATLSTPDTNVTPELASVNITYALVVNSAPNAPTLDSTSIAEGVSFAGTLTADDPDGDDVTFSLATDAPQCDGNNNALFAPIVGDQLSSIAAFDYESLAPSHQVKVCVVASDEVEQAVSLLVIDVTNLAPSAPNAPTPLSHPEGPQAYSVQLAGAVDPAGGAVTYAFCSDLASAYDEESFMLTPAGLLTANSGFDFESGKLSYTLCMTSSDGQLSSTSTVSTINVMNQNDVAWGNCNVSGANPLDARSVNATDLAAIVLEIWDEDGNNWLDAPSGSFHGSPEGCNPQQFFDPGNTTIRVGDVSCLVNIFFGTGCAPELLAADAAGNTVLGATASAEGSVDISLDAQEQNVAAVGFTLELGKDVLFDATDGDGDMLPDAITFHIGENIARWARYDADRHAVQVVIADISLSGIGLDGVLATVHVAGDALADGALRLRDASVGSANGVDLPLELMLGGVVVDDPDATPVDFSTYLPAVTNK